MPTPSNDPGDLKYDRDRIPTLLVPDETLQATLIELFDALEQSGFLIRHRDGFEVEETVAYDITRLPDARGDEMVGIVPTPDPPTVYEIAFQHARNEILAGAAYDAAVNILGHHLAVAVQHLLDAEAADPDFDEPGRHAITDAMRNVEDQVSTAVLGVAWNHVEVDR